MVALANGLPIYFTNINGQHVANEAALTTGQVLLGLGRGFSQIPLQVALQAVVPDAEIGIATAFFLSSSGFGANAGNSISGAIWNTILPRKLQANLPEAARENATAIFRSIVVAQSFEKGTPTRDAIDLSYRQTQQTLAIGSFAISVPLLVLMLLSRNIQLGKEDEKRQEELEQEGVVLEEVNKTAAANEKRA